MQKTFYVSALDAAGSVCLPSTAFVCADHAQTVAGEAARIIRAKGLAGAPGVMVHLHQQDHSPYCTPAPASEFVKQGEAQS